MVEHENENVDVGSGDMGQRQPATEGDTIVELEGVKNSSGQVCIECAACGFAVARSVAYVKSMKTMKCPHCLTNYRVRI